MKKLLLIPALMFGSMALATDYNYELTPVIGYNIPEGNLDIDDQTLVGFEAQYNGFNSIIKPELSALYTKTDYNYAGATDDTSIYRVALNGVYEFEKLGFLIPLAKAGIGYEAVSDRIADMKDSPFLDAAVGAKIPFSDTIALKLEALYMFKTNHANWDSNLALLAGLNLAFGPKAEVAPEPTPEPIVVPVVDRDDDNDGVKNSIDKCPTTKAGVKVDSKGCKIDGDDDHDGVKNSIDECPTSPAGATVNAKGCPVIINLNMNFDKNSYSINADDDVRIQMFADFLNMYNNYSAKIIGYTSDTASDAYNQKLSENRANAVKESLIQKGIDANRIAASGMGKLNPIADNSTFEGRAKNRRIEAELSKN